MTQKLIVGLGNPGDQYKNTRHNIGFTMLDEFVNSNNLGDFSYDNKYGGETFTTLLNGQKVAFLKPMEYMNRSGGPVSKLANFFKIEPKDILVIHDEIDLPVGTLKLKFGGGLAGHNGLKDIAQKLGTQDFWRIRIGVDRPATSNMVADYVLSTFKPNEKNLLIEQKDTIFELIEDFLGK